MLEKEQNEMLKLDNQLCFPLYAAARLIVQAYGPNLRKMKITYPQYLVMLVLWENDGLTVKEIGNLLLLDSGTLTPILKRLQSLGFLTRKRSQTDDRTVHNYLTKKALSLKPKAAEMSFSLFCKSGLTLTEAQDLKGATQNLIQKLQTLISPA